MARGVLRSPLPWLGGLIVIYLAFPLVAFGIRFLGAPRRGFHVPGLFPSLFISLESATISLALITALGVPLAYLLSRSRSRLASLIGLVVLLPLALPPLMSGILLIYLVGPYTFLGRLLRRPSHQFTGRHRPGPDISRGPVSDRGRPHCFRCRRTGHVRHGRHPGPLRALRFRLVAIPLAAPGIRAGMALAWLRAFGEYGAVIILASTRFPCRCRPTISSAGSICPRRWRPRPWLCGGGRRGCAWPSGATAPPALTAPSFRARPSRSHDANTRGVTFASTTASGPSAFRCLIGPAEAPCWSSVPRGQASPPSRFAGPGRGRRAGALRSGSTAEPRVAGPPGQLDEPPLRAPGPGLFGECRRRRRRPDHPYRSRAGRPGRRGIAAKGL